MKKTASPSLDQRKAAYKKFKNVHKAAESIGMRGGSLHRILVREGVVCDGGGKAWTQEEIDVVTREYPIYREAGKIGELAKKLGRTRASLALLASRSGLSDRNHKHVWQAVWKYITEESASVIWGDFKSSRLGLGKYCQQHGLDDRRFAKAMKRFFADEWEAVIEAKQPKQTMYRRGRQFEYRVRDHLKSLGYVALRSPASKSPMDLMAVRPGVVLFVQCKVGGALPVVEWNELMQKSASCGALPICAIRIGVKELIYKRLTNWKDGSKSAQPWVDFDPAIAKGVVNVSNLPEPSVN